MDTNTCLHLIPKSEGGIKQHFLSIVEGLLSMPLKHLVAGPKDKDFEDILRQLSIPYYSLNWSNRSDLINLCLLQQQCLSILRKEDIKLVHSHGHKQSFTSRVAMGLTQKHPIKNIVTLHNFSPSSKAGRLLKKANQYLDNQTTRIIAVSKALRDEEVLQLNHYKTKIIYNGIDLDKFQPIARDHLETTNIGIIARLAPQKGIEYLLQAFKAISLDFPDVRLQIIGDGPEKGKLTKLANQLQLQEKVSFLGSIQDVRSVLANLDIFVMPSISEGLSIATIEAMAMAKPVVASRTGGLIELIEDDKNGILVAPKDTLALAAAIRRLITNRSLRIEMSQKSKERANTFFNKKTMQAQTIALYQEILD
ncbi:MAG: glycosyltransferase family 4 protein [Bacillota bacterium]|nr:glycosyltransferase family 4 protein [Bacillota bacterium]